MHEPVFVARTQAGPAALGQHGSQLAAHFIRSRQRQVDDRHFLDQFDRQRVHGRHEQQRLALFREHRNDVAELAADLGLRHIRMQVLEQKQMVVRILNDLIQEANGPRRRRLIVQRRQRPPGQ